LVPPASVSASASSSSSDTAPAPSSRPHTPLLSAEEETIAGASATATTTASVTATASTAANNKPHGKSQHSKTNSIGGGRESESVSGGVGLAPVDLFDDVMAQVLADLKLDIFPRFLQSTFYQRYIQVCAVEGRTKFEAYLFYVFRNKSNCCLY
jgi:hypothetical protein